MKHNYFRAILSLFALAMVIFGAADAANAQTPTPSPQAQFRKKYDFNGDGKADLALLSVYYPANSSGIISFYIANSPNDQFRAVQWGGGGDAPVAGDYDGDGRADFAVLRVENNLLAWYILNSQATNYRRVAFGLSSSDTAVPADYDGDGKDDIAVARYDAPGNTFTYYWLRSSDGQVGGRTVSRETANTECRPSIPGDYNGDGKADFVVRCRLTATNQQYFNITDNAANTAQRVNWGIFTQYTNNGTTYFREGDVFVPGDYDGDGKTDLAVVRDTLSSVGNNNTGTFTWYIRRSSNGALQAQQYGGHNAIDGWGSYFDLPTPADYDGDGKTDFSVSRDTALATGYQLQHHVMNSSNGALRSMVFGYNDREVRLDRALVNYTGTSIYMGY